MTVIKKENGIYGVFNEAGFQVEGSFAANLTGLNPREMLEASLAMCLTIVIQRMFERDGIEVQDGEFSVEVNAVKAEGSPSRFEKCNVVITLPDHLSNEYKNKLIVSAERGCTIGNTLRKGITIETNHYPKN